MKKKIFIYDTTLRDGSQGENISFSVDEKIRIAKKLDQFGIDYIEGGWPGSNPKDKDFFKKIKKEKLKNAKIVAFSSTRRKNINISEDENFKELLKSQTDFITLFGKTWDLHVKQIMKNSLKENLAMIKDSIKFLKLKNKKVFYDAEHFFDGYKSNPEYAIETLKVALKSGAEFLVLCDSNGGTLHNEIYEITKNIKSIFGKNKLGIHTHNDSGLAVANSLIAVDAGIEMIQGTINGYGERCGNADLISIIPNLKLKMNYECIKIRNNLSDLKSLSNYISESANMISQNNHPFVGKSAFAHKGGIHVSAVLKNPKAYEHIDPKLIGNERRVIISDLSGKSNITYKAKEMNIKLDDKEAKGLTQEIKLLENKGYQFDAADASFEILMLKYSNKFKKIFDLEYFQVIIEKNKEKESFSRAIIKIDVKGKKQLAIGEASGPVGALDIAMREALGKFFPKIKHMSLVDFKVRVIDGRDGTGAIVRVLIDSKDKNNKIWTTIGVSKDLIDASFMALADSFNYYLNQ